MKHEIVGKFSITRLHRFLLTSVLIELLMQPPGKIGHKRAIYDKRRTYIYGIGTYRKSTEQHGSVGHLTVAVCCNGVKIDEQLDTRNIT